MELLILAFLIVLNGLFALSEMAVVSSRKARLQQWAEDRRAGAAAALALANQPSSFLSTIQVGITLIGITAGAFGEAALSEDLTRWLAQWPALDAYAYTLASALVIAGITVGSLIVGELVPKRIALLNPEAVASAVARPMQLLSKAARPLVWALSSTTEAVLRLLRLRNVAQPPVTEEEIRVLMEQGAQAGVFQAHEQGLVARALRFDRLKVGAIMTPRSDMVCLDLAEPVEEIRSRIIAHGHSRFPVVEGGLDNVRGIVRARMLLADALEGKPLELTRHLATPLYVPIYSSAIELMELFKRHRETIAIAINEHGAVEGVVTLNDVMEALVGDVAMVEAEEEREILRRDDGSWLIDGAATIERLRTALEIDEPLPGEQEGAYHTVAGFVLEQLGRVPRTGERFHCRAWRWEVVDMDERRVDKVLATPEPRAEHTET